MATNTSSSTEYDVVFDELQRSNLLEWKPWIGESYGMQGKKLLIIGESHYKVENTVLKSIDKGSTRIMIHNFGLYGLSDQKKPLHRFLRNTEKALFNKISVTKAESQNLWRSVSFYNFIQRPMDTQQHRPGKQDWIKGWETFFKIIDIIKPDHVLFCGLTAFENDFFKEAIKDSGYSCEKGIVKKSEKVKGTFVRTKGIILKDDKEISITCMRHPSQAFSWTGWHKIIKRYMPEYINGLLSILN